MSEWVYFIHPPREDFVETITDEESAIMQTHSSQAARAVMMSDPAITSGLMTGELRPMRVTFLHGRG